jgi:hypothetical protein
MFSDINPNEASSFTVAATGLDSSFQTELLIVNQFFPSAYTS